MKTFARKIWMTIVMTAMPCAAMAQAPVLVPQEYRIKIDDVDVSKAPEISIRATFLDKKALPVSPKKITGINVFADDDLVTSSPKISTLKDSDVPLDLSIIVPISQRFTEDELESMKKSLSHIIEQARENDRVAGFFDDGRAINVAPLGSAADVTALLKGTSPQGQPSFLYSSLEKAIDEMSDPAKMRNPARRAIILVTDAFDTYTYRAADVQREIFDIYKRARQNDIRIYIVMYKPFIRSLIPIFEGLSRKTGGTYRYADFTDQISKNIDYAWGEIYGQLFIDFKHSGLREGQDVVYRIDATREGGVFVEADSFKEVSIKELKFDWKFFGIVCAIIVGILLIALIIFLIIRNQRKKKAEMDAAIAEQELQEKIERGEACPKCRRTMMPDWKECMFCAREAAEEINQAKAENRAKAIAEAEKKGVKLEGRICPECNRTLMPQWKECLFCKAGIGGGGGPKKGVAPRGPQKQKEAPAERQCPVCKRTMKAHWTTCLFCEADAGNRPEVAPPPSKAPQAPQQPQARVCPDCGRPMKAHWDICLYCEANRARQ